MSKLSAIQRQALADLDTLELGLIHDTVSRTAHLGNMVAHSVMATPRAVVGAFKGAARAAIDNHRRLSHHLKEATAKNKTLGQRAKHMGRAVGSAFVAAPIRSLARTSGGAVKGYANAILTGSHHMQKAIGNKDFLHSKSKPMMLHDY